MSASEVDQGRLDGRQSKTASSTPAVACRGEAKAAESVTEVQPRMWPNQLAREAWNNRSELLAAAQTEKKSTVLHTPVGPNWQKPGQLCQFPGIQGQPATSWLINERQEVSGRYRPWLFFETATGKYYQAKEEGGFMETKVPHSPVEHQMQVQVSNVCAFSDGKKLDMAVLLPELHKTGFMLKQPLQFLDKPAALFLLCDGLRNNPAAAEFCAKRFHTVLLPRLSSRATVWEDFELEDLLRDSFEALDALLLDSAARLSGCSVAVALVVGRRLVVGSLGGTRCVLCSPQNVVSEAGGGNSLTAKLISGGSAHTAANRDECLRVASVGNRLLQTSVEGHDDHVSADIGQDGELHARSASAAILESVDGELEREMLRVARSSNPFAALGVSKSDLLEGPAAVRRIFRRRSLVLHPDKVRESDKQRAMAAFAKLEASAAAVEAMLHTDLDATVLLAEVDAAHDETWLVSDPAAAARLIGVPEGCSSAAVSQTIQQRYHGPLSRLQDVCPTAVAQALGILSVAEESLARGTVLWTPPREEEGVHVTRALGCADLKTPTRLLSTVLSTKVVSMEPGSSHALALLADGARSLTQAEVAARLQKHWGRPRAAALRLASDGSRRTLVEDRGSDPVGVICAFFGDGALGSLPAGNDEAILSQLPATKRPRGAGPPGKQPERVRVSHVLLRWSCLKDADPCLRHGWPAATRTQIEAELMLLELLEEILAGDTKTRGARFKAAVLNKSECASALNAPHADLGWLERQGGTDPAIESAAFGIGVGDISDVVITRRGAHLVYRLA
eukprot:TRINITY_DN67051_c0_g1_i1.p1 TRINITY_DN67051_c0_g1~~TRINITY_DN67051_c0_g1_i1.p1  ORF type:complete len:792 (+),score=115.60 TRINITY_DN67051_c0_g1_i1:101-2476(+)